jgi:hypothetical protein
MQEGVGYIRTQRIRFCRCGQENEWPLDEGQKPIGYNVDEEMRGDKAYGSCTRTEES